MGIALFFALTAVASTGARYDAEQHRLTAKGAAAADWNTPNAAVARVAAERAARQHAETKLSAALALLHCASPDDIEVAALVKGAKITDERYGSDGSVDLVLQLSTVTLDCKSVKP